MSGREAVLSCWYGRSHHLGHIDSPIQYNTIQYNTIQYKHCPPLQKHAPIVDVRYRKHSFCLPSSRRYCLLCTRWRFRFVGTWSLTKPNRWTLQALLPGIPPLPSFRAEVYVAPVSFTMSEEESKNTARFRRRYQADPTRRTKNETTSGSAQPMHRRCCSSSFQRLRRHLMPLSGQFNRRISSFSKMR